MWICTTVVDSADKVSVSSMQDTWPSSAHYSRKSKDTDGSSKPVMETNNVQVKMDENEKRKKKGGGGNGRKSNGFQFHGIRENSFRSHISSNDTASFDDCHGGNGKSNGMKTEIPRI